MKKLGALLLVVVLSISAVGAVNAGVWEDYFPDSEMFDGSVFVNDTVETNVTEEQKEPEKDWLERNQKIFQPGWANETRHSNFPPRYFDIAPREQLTNFPPDYFKVDWGIKGVN